VLDGKAGGLTAHKPGDFDIRRVSLEPASFSGFGDWALRKIPFRNPVFFSLPQSCKERIMLSFLSVHRARRFLSVGFILLAMAAVLGGCDTDPDPNPDYPINSTTLPNGLLGEWAATYDSFSITRGSGIETVEYHDGGFGYGCKGTVRFVSRFNAKDGVIIIELTEFKTNPDNKKPFHAIYYLDFKPGVSVELNEASDPEPPYNADTATLNEAQNKFTFDNRDNYINEFFSVPYYKMD
jgi:hypothetical protein